MGSGQSAGRPGSVHPDGLVQAELTGALDGLPLVRRDELVNVAGRTLRRSRQHGGHVAVAPVRLNGMAGAETATDLLRTATDGVPAAASPAGTAVDEELGRSAGEISEEAVSTVRPRWNAAEADPQPGAGTLGHDLPALADMLVRCLFTAGLAVQSAATLADGPVAAQLEQVTDQLDGIICDIRTAVFESQAPEHRYSPQAS